MMLIMLFEFFIGITDIYVAGRIGKEIQATYGFVIQMYFIFVIIANALTAGTVSVVSRLFTSGGSGLLRNAVFSVIITTVISGVFFSMAGLLLTPVLVHIINIPSEIKPLVAPLGRIYAAGLIFHYILINTNGILRACKQVRSSLKTMTVVCLVNIGLNLYLVFETGIGYRGIAYSTAIAVFTGSMINLLRMKVFLRGVKKFSPEIVKQIIGIGWPFGISQILWQLHSMVIYLILSALPRNSIETLAAFTAGLRIESAIFLPAMALNMANAVIVGNLLGENKKSDAFKAGIITAIMGLGIVTCLTGVVIASARWIAPFLSNSPIVIEECVRYLYISMLSEPFMAFWMILGGALSGAGDTKGIMFIVASCTWLVRIPLSFLWVIVFGLDASAVWWMMNFSQVLVSYFIVRRYRQKKWLQSAVTR